MKTVDFAEIVAASDLKQMDLSIRPISTKLGM